MLQWISIFSEDADSRSILNFFVKLYESSENM